MIENDKKLLEIFLGQFPIDKLKDLKLERYTNTGDDRKNTDEDGNERDDFTYWVEWKLDSLGGIKGGSSYKFGIYKCNSKPDIKTKGYKYDPENKYAWAEKYEPEGKSNISYLDVFEEIRKRLVDVAEAAWKDDIDYHTIETTFLGDAFKWKVAFLYSRNRLIPVYKKEALYNAAKILGYEGSDEEGDKKERNKKQRNKKITIAGLQVWLKEYYENHKDDYCPKDKNGKYKEDEGLYDFGCYVWRIGTADLSQSNQIIKYGAPGTGKTYTAKQEAKEFFKIWKLNARNTSAEFDKHYKFVQFHPSYSYEDFIEGIKPVINNGGNTELKLINGIFKAFCKEAAKYEIWLLNKGIIKPYDKENGTQLSEVSVVDVKKKQDKNCPFDFPQSAKPNDPIAQYIPPYFFVIDEINRADLSRVFGELMYCLEYRDYEGRIKTQYSELESKETDTIFYEENGEHWFFIPNNVYIIGTMNTIDRSIESFDFALRRRFLWQRIEPNESVLQEYFEEKNKNDFGEYIIPLWSALNNAIEGNAILGPDYQIGHSYLMKLDKYPNLSKTAYRDIIWEKHIKPILEEYFRGMGEEAQKQIDTLKNKFIPKKQNSKSTKAGNQNTNPEIADNNEQA